AGGRIAGVRWRIRPFAPVADREWAEGLWVAAMASSWPLLPAGIALLTDGLVAEAEAGPVGLVGVDLAGGILLILIHPACQGRGVGTGLLAAAGGLPGAGGARGGGARRGGGALLRPRGALGPAGAGAVVT